MPAASRRLWIVKSKLATNCYAGRVSVRFSGPGPDDPKANPNNKWKINIRLSTCARSRFSISSLRFIAGPLLPSGRYRLAGRRLIREAGHDSAGLGIALGVEVCDVVQLRPPVMGAIACLKLQSKETHWPIEPIASYKAPAVAFGVILQFRSLKSPGFPSIDLPADGQCIGV